jgi:hypothetical protein
MLSFGSSATWIYAVLFEFESTEHIPDYGAWISRNPLTRIAEFGAGIALCEVQRRLV